MNLKISLLFVLAFFAANQTFSRSYFDKEKDLLLACFDLKPDEDDVMAAAGLASMLQHQDLAGIHYYAVAGAYGEQTGKFISTAVPDFYNQLFGKEHTYWTNADANWEASVVRARDKVKAVLNGGGKVFVMEAGQSNFTYDVLQAVIASGISASTFKENIVVVQHSKWNEKKSTAAELSWVKNNTEYVRLEDGNKTNATPAYKTEDSSWLSAAKSSDNPNRKTRDYWTLADDICTHFTPTWVNEAIAGGGVDFSDCVEVWWIFDLGEKADSIDKFWSRYVVHSKK
ncbi:MAG: hypothetical protein AAGA66_20200 [Bacteroidota bacterium]